MHTSMHLRLYVSAISPVSVDGFLPNFLPLVHLGTKMNWLGFGVKGQGHIFTVVSCHRVKLSRCRFFELNQLMYVCIFQAIFGRTVFRRLIYSLCCGRRLHSYQASDVGCFVSYQLSCLLISSISCLQTSRRLPFTVDVNSSCSIPILLLVSTLFDMCSYLAFLLFARHVPNVAKRSIWEQCKKYILRTDRSTNDRPLNFENFKRPYLCEGSSDPLHVWFYSGVFWVSGSNSAISSWTKKFNRYVWESNAWGVIRLVTI